MKRFYKVLSLLMVVLFSGCKSSHFPEPISRTDIGNKIVLAYDLDRDGKPEYQQVLGPKGKVEELRYDDNEDGNFELVVDVKQKTNIKKIIIGLDGVPYTLMKKLYDEGYFRIFHSPARHISVLPAITEMYLTEMLGVRYPGGYGLSFFNKAHNQLEGNLLHDYEIAIWDDIYDYISPILDKGLFYIIPETGPADIRSMKRVIRRLYKKQDLIMLHLDATDSLCHKYGLEELVPLLKAIDKGLQEIYHEYRGEMEIVLYSDHGNNLKKSDRIPIEEYITKNGYNMRGDGVYGDKDVFILATGLINAAYLYMRPDTEPEIADILTGLEGIEFSVYEEGMTKIVYVVASGSKARILKDGEYYKYEMIEGDPLGVGPFLKELEREGKVRPDGFVHDRDLLAKTYMHKYPDIINRCYGAVTTHVKHKADVMSFIEDGMLCGSPALNLWLKFKSTHAGPSKESITGILMSTDQELPEYVRCEEALDVLGMREIVNERLRQKNIEMQGDVEHNPDAREITFSSIARDIKKIHH